MSEKIFLGIDTSCYTTSVAAIDMAGSLIGYRRKLLTVKKGARGLQQSEMVFQHVRNLPELVEEMFGGGSYKVMSVTASGYPRLLEGSYMPAFLAGCGLARSLAVACGASLNIISHQENHIEAGVWSAGAPCSEKFLVLHASGGTTDLILVEAKADARYELKEIGGSCDLHAGQFIDRIGVALGLAFPAGPSLEKLATGAASNCCLPVSVKNAVASLSGPATAAERMLASGAGAAELARGVEYVLAETFARLFINGAALTGAKEMLLVGGVGCNKFIRSHLEKRLTSVGAKFYVPQAEFSGDNAVGCAVYGWRTGIGR